MVADFYVPLVLRLCPVSVPRFEDKHPMTSCFVHELVSLLKGGGLCIGEPTNAYQKN